MLSLPSTRSNKVTRIRIFIALDLISAIYAECVVEMTWIATLAADAALRAVSEVRFVALLLGGSSRLPFSRE
jgi:hypothetical protein